MIAITLDTAAPPPAHGTRGNAGRARPSGAGDTTGRAQGTTFTRSTTPDKQLIGRDRDKDGIACERR
ncbi:MAG: excalibur calcium-binding domain-containing protein [Propionicimonas sp.]